MLVGLTKIWKGSMLYHLNDKWSYCQLLSVFLKQYKILYHQYSSLRHDLGIGLSPLKGQKKRISNEVCTRMPMWIKWTRHLYVYSCCAGWFPTHATDWLTNSKMRNKILCFNTSNTKILRYQGAQVRAQRGGSRTRMQVNCICSIRVHFKLNRKP